MTQIHGMSSGTFAGYISDAWGDVEDYETIDAIYNNFVSWAYLNSDMYLTRQKAWEVFSTSFSFQNVTGNHPELFGSI